MIRAMKEGFLISMDETSIFQKRFSMDIPIPAFGFICQTMHARFVFEAHRLSPFAPPP